MCLNIHIAFCGVVKCYGKKQSDVHITEQIHTVHAAVTAVIVRLAVAGPILVIRISHTACIIIKCVPGPPTEK